MRHSLPLAAALTLALAACQSLPSTTHAPAGTTASPETNATDARFAALSKRWLDGTMQLNPVNATQLGDHRFDAEVDDLSAAGRQRMLDFSTRMLAATGRRRRSSVRYCTASPTWPALNSSTPSRSAIVRAILSTR